MTVKVLIFIRKHADGAYTVSVPAVPGIEVHGRLLEACKREVAQALTQGFSRMRHWEAMRLAANSSWRRAPLVVELQAPGSRGKRRDTTIQFAVTLLVTRDDDGPFVVTAPRLTRPPLIFSLPEEAELAAAAKAELSRYFQHCPVEAIQKYQADQDETIEELQVKLEFKEPRDAMPEKTDGAPSRLDQVGIQLTADASVSALARAYRRESEVTGVLSALAGARPCLVLIGPSGVGKTAIVHEVVHRIREGHCPAALQGREVWSVTGPSLLANNKYIGQWEGTLAAVLAEVRPQRHILFVEDIASLVEAGRHDKSDTNMGDVLRPHLQTGSITIVGESTPERWRYAERLHPGFVAQFRTLQVEPADEAQTLSIVNSVARGIEQREQVRISPAASEAALDLTSRFLPYRAQPGKALRLIEQMVSDYRQRQVSAGGGETTEPALTRKDVVATFTRQTGLPEFLLADDLLLDLAAVRKHFAERVVGQEQAADAMVNLIAVIKAGLNDPQKPLGSFLFIGPTGVGKTQMAKTLAKYLFGDEGRVIRFDMSEYGDPAGIRRLIGAAGSDQEGELTGKVRGQPFCVLLLDEFEKVDPLIHDLFLQVLGEGRLTDATGATTSFQNAIIVMTSNLGASARAQRALGLVSDDKSSAGRDPAYWQGKVEDYFRPEFVNRIDQIVAFRPLSPETTRRIAQRELGEVLLRKGLTRRNLLVEIDDSVIDLLVEQGFSAAYGARPLKRAIEQRVVLPLARFMAGRTEFGSDLLRLSRQGDEVTLSVIHFPEEEIDQSGAAPGRGPAPLESARPRGSRKRLLLSYFDLIAGFAQLRARLQSWSDHDLVAEMRSERNARLAQTSHPTFWDDPEAARATLGRFYFLERLLKRLQQLTDQAAYLEEFARLVHQQQNPGYRWELAESYERLARNASFLELELLCASIEANHHAMLAFSPVHAKAQDEEDARWTTCLAAMYLRWANRKGYEIEVAANLVPAGEGQRGGELRRTHPYRWQHLATGNFDALIKAVAELAEVRKLVILLSGANVYGFLKGEDGLHRRSDQSPDGDRSQQFAVVGVTAWEGSSEAVLDRILEARAVEKGDGDDIAHTGPGAVVAAEVVVRNYRFHGQRQVYDPRTKARNYKINDVLEGDLDDFILAYLRQIEPVTAWGGKDA